MPRWIPYARQNLSESDVAAVVDVLRSDFLTSGPKVEEFERTFAARVGARHAVAVSSGTAALHLAMLATGIGPGDRVVTSPNSFVASANCAAYVGAVPDFADIDPVTYNLAAETLDRNWKPSVRAVIAVDYAGQSCDMPAIAAVARSHGAVVIEDASHAVGGGFRHDGKSWNVGGHPWADVTTFSFHPVKNMTTGEGGMIVTDSDEWAELARCLRSHGVVRDAANFSAETCSATVEHGPWYYEMQELGFNYRPSELHCALGLSQLGRLDDFVARRREIHSRYDIALADLPWLATPGVRSEEDRRYIAWHLYTVLIDFPALRKTRTEVMQELRAKGVGTQVLYIPIHLQPWYRKTFGYGPGKCPIAEDYYLRTLSLPLFPAMEDADVDQVITAVRALS